MNKRVVAAVSVSGLAFALVALFLLATFAGIAVPFWGIAQLQYDVAEELGRHEAAAEISLSAGLYDPGVTVSSGYRCQQSGGPTSYCSSQ